LSAPPNDLTVETVTKFTTKKESEIMKVKNVGEVYRCEICGNIVEVKEAGGGELVCCGEPMKLVQK